MVEHKKGPCQGALNIPKAGYHGLRGSTGKPLAMRQYRSGWSFWHFAKPWWFGCTCGAANTAKAPRPKTVSSRLKEARRSSMVPGGSERILPFPIHVSRIAVFLNIAPTRTKSLGLAARLAPYISAAIGIPFCALTGRVLSVAFRQVWTFSSVHRVELSAEPNSIHGIPGSPANAFVLN